MAHGIAYTDVELVNEQYDLYKDLITSIAPPPHQNIVWQNPNTRTKLGLLIVEPRCHELLQGVLYNVAHIYGGTNAVLYIVHGTENEQYVKNITRKWINVKYFNLGKKNIDRNEYNQLLTTSSFWTAFSTEYILVFQTDSFIRHKVPEIFYYFDFVGAPWRWTPGNNGRLVGNGGFSLRKLSSIKQVCDKHEFDPILLEGEDVFFSTYLPIDTVPPASLASCFSVEHVYHDNPCGMHQIWRFQSWKDIKNLFDTSDNAAQMFTNFDAT